MAVRGGVCRARGLAAVRRIRRDRRSGRRCWRRPAGQLVRRPCLRADGGRVAARRAHEDPRGGLPPDRHGRRPARGGRDGAGRGAHLRARPARLDTDVHTGPARRRRRGVWPGRGRRWCVAGRRCRHVRDDRRTGRRRVAAPDRDYVTAGEWRSLRPRRRPRGHDPGRGRARRQPFRRGWTRVGVHLRTPRVELGADGTPHRARRACRR